ncbi:ParB/RepB/Spo0J family partition protein [Pseudomonas sp. MWU12-2115]
MSNVAVTSMPYNRLRRSEANVRRGRDTAAYKAGIEKLAASILAVHKLTGQGLLQNLVVNLVGDFGAVVAGGRRYDALGLLIEQGEFQDDYPVSVQVVADHAVTAASLTENVQRVAMHPADEFDAFLAMVEQGWTIDAVADAFGVTPLVVERRLKLRAAAPSLIEDFRADLLTTDQLIALCTTDSHERQVAAWSRVRNNQHWGATPNELRRAVMEAEVEAAKDPRVAFIGGVEAYEKAGGRVRRDLFAADGEGVILEDAALLATLVQDRLMQAHDELATEGWGWIEVWPGMDWTALERLGQAPTIKVELSAEAAQQVAELESQLEKVRTSIEGLLEATPDADLSEEAQAQMDALEEEHQNLEDQIAEINKQAVIFDPAVMEHCGALVMYYHGELRIERGRVRAADREKVSALLGDEQRIAGGRTSEPAGRKTDALSDALRRSLLGYRNLAAQTATAKNAKAAKVLLVCKFIADARSTYGVVPTDLSVTNGYGARTNCTISDDAGQALEAEFVNLGNAMIESLPKDPSALWDVLEGMKPVDLDNLLAFAVARSVSLSVAGDGLSPKFLEALGLSMADHFTPTAENYLGRVSKDLILEALTEAGKIGGEDDRSALLAMKKGALAKEAETRLQGTGWVPKVIRTEKTKPAGGKVSGKKSGNK